MATIFTKIAHGEIPSFKVAESEDFYAFLDIAPMAKGHTLVIPKNVEDDYIFHLDEPTYAGLWAFARKVAKAIEAAVPCRRVGVAVLGMEVPPRPAPDRSRHGLPEGEAQSLRRGEPGHRGRYPESL